MRRTHVSADRSVAAPQARVVRLLGFAVLWLLVSLTGCANLSAIREFATISSDAVAYRRLVSDYVAAPARGARYVPPPCTECARQTAERQRQEPLLLLEQEVLQAYMEALGALAADDLVDFSTDYDALGKAAQNAKLIAANEAEAAGTIAKVLTKAATDHWRQRQLKQIIAQANAPVQVVVAGMQTIMSAFELEVDVEKTKADNYYRTLALEARERPCARCSAPSLAAIEEWQVLRVAEIGQRHRSVQGYRAVLSTIGAGHQKLFDERDDLASEDTLRQIKAYSRDLRKAYKALQELRG
jgi:hypothetical protein